MAASQPQYDALKQAVGSLGFVRPGSVVRRFMPCGNPGCRCMADPPQLHGPYYQWSYKVRGKTVSVRLNEAQARLCEEWLQNHRQLRVLVRLVPVGFHVVHPGRQIPGGFHGGFSLVRFNVDHSFHAVYGERRGGQGARGRGHEPRH